MKLASVLFAAVAALSAVHVDANGVCYDPDHTSGKSASTVAEDMALIASMGFDTVRTYISYFGSTEMGPIIAAAGLSAALGVPYPNSDYSSQATAAISAAASGGVSYIFVGNENLAGASSVPSAMIDLISSIKSQVSQYGVKVGTVQRNTEVIGYSSISGWSDLVSACDVLGVNVHPFFTSGTSADDAMALVQTQWNTMYSNFGSKLLLTETGWPTSGSYGSNTGSVSGLQTFYSDYQSWMSSQSQSFFFQMYDTPSKSEAYEQTFGLLTYDSQNKFTMASSPTSSPSTTSPATTSPATTSPATETPEPTTATPEPTTATPEPTTATPEPTTATPESTGSDDSSTSTDVALEADDDSEGSDSSSLRGSVGSAGSYGSSSSDVEYDVGSDDKVADEADSDDITTNSSTTAGTAADGTSGDAQTTGTDASGSSTRANNQSADSSGTSYVGLAIGGGACAAMVAFGVIYQSRKRAQELENLDDKRDDSFPSAVTPVENINVL